MLTLLRKFNPQRCDAAATDRPPPSPSGMAASAAANLVARQTQHRFRRMIRIPAPAAPAAPAAVTAPVGYPGGGSPVAAAVRRKRARSRSSSVCSR